MSGAHQARFVSPLDLLIYFRSVVSVDSLSNADLALLASEANERFVPAGTVLLDAEQPVEKVYILVEGRVEIDAGAYKEIVEPPTGINWLRLHGGFETNRSARALVDSLVLEISASKMIEQLERNPSMVEQALRMYARHILLLRDHLPVRPDNAAPADPGSRPDGELGLVARMREIAGPGAYWEHANLDAVVTVVREMEEVRLKKGEVLWEQGSRSSNTLNLVCGTVECTNEAGRSVEVGAGFVLGFFDALADAPRCFRAVASSDGVALRSNLNEMLAVLQHHSDMALDLLRGVSRSLSQEYDAYHISGRARDAPILPLGPGRPKGFVPDDAS